MSLRIAIFVALLIGAIAGTIITVLGKALQRSVPASSSPSESFTEKLTPNIEHGRRWYVKSCAHCHGDDVTGDEGPDLHRIYVSDRRIATVIHDGIPHEMPSFAKKLTRQQVADVIAYLRSLGPASGEYNAG